MMTSTCMVWDSWACQQLQMPSQASDGEREGKARAPGTCASTGLGNRWPQPAFPRCGFRLRPGREVLPRTDETTEGQRVEGSVPGQGAGQESSESSSPGILNPKASVLVLLFSHFIHSVSLALSFPPDVILSQPLTGSLAASPLSLLPLLRPLWGRASFSQWLPPGAHAHVSGADVTSAGGLQCTPICPEPLMGARKGAARPAEAQPSVPPRPLQLKTSLWGFS